MAMTGQDWAKVGGAVFGAVLVGLQGMNLSETNAGNAKGAKNGEVLQQLLALTHGMNEGLAKQQLLLSHDDEVFARQDKMLEFLKAASAERQTLLEKALHDNPKPAATP